MKKILKIVPLMLACYLICVMITNPAACISAAKEALRLCAEVVIPSLFPFFVCSNLLIGLGGTRMLSRYLSRWMRPLFGIPGAGALAVVLGVVSGYPVGADCVAELYASGECTKTEAERMLAFCNNSGPLFVMGAIGVGMLNNPKLGAILYLVHLLSAMLTGVIFRRYGRNGKQTMSLPLPSTGQNSGYAISTAVADGVVSILKVCGYVVVFAVIGAAIPSWRGSRLLYALLEITGGIRSIIQSQELGRFLLPTISLFLALSGVSVMMQVEGIVSPVGLSMKSYLLGKLTQGLLAFFLTGPALGLFCPELSVFLAESIPVPMISPKGILLLSLCMILWCWIFLGLLTLAVWLGERKKDRFKAKHFWHTNRKRRGKNENLKALSGDITCLPNPDRMQGRR